MIKGTTEGDYLNIYNDPGIEPNKDTPYKDLMSIIPGY